MGKRSAQTTTSASTNASLVTSSSKGRPLCGSFSAFTTAVLSNLDTESQTHLGELLREYLPQYFSDSSSTPVSNTKPQKPVKSVKKPHKTPYQVYVAHKMNDATNNNLAHLDRMRWIGAQWKNENDDVKSRCKQCADVYNQTVDSLGNQWESDLKGVGERGQSAMVSTGLLSFIRKPGQTDVSSSVVEPTPSVATVVPPPASASASSQTVDSHSATTSADSQSVAKSKRRTLKN